jgi:hypothetical protein
LLIALRTRYAGAQALTAHPERGDVNDAHHGLPLASRDPDYELSGTGIACGVPGSSGGNSR